MLPVINKGVYLFTLLRIGRTKTTYFLAMCFALLVPLCGAVTSQLATGGTTDNLMLHSYPCTFLFGLALAVTVSLIGTASALSGKSDYLPLVLTRPMSRSTYVLSKYFALATVIGIVSFGQVGMIAILSPDKLPPPLLAAGVLERILDILSVSSVLILVLSLPTRSMIAFAIVFLEFLAAFVLFGQMTHIAPELVGNPALAMANKLGPVNSMYSNYVQPFVPFDALILSGGQFVFSTILSFVSPSTFAYDLLNLSNFTPAPWIVYLFDIFASLSMAVVILDHRDVNYATE